MDLNSVVGVLSLSLDQFTSPSPLCSTTYRREQSRAKTNIFSRPEEAKGSLCVCVCVGRVHVNYALEPY